MSDLAGIEPPKIDWTPGPDLAQRLKRFRQKCELLFDGPLKEYGPTNKDADMSSYGPEITVLIYSIRGI